MNDFEAALRDKLDRNVEIDRDREATKREQQERERQRREEEARRAEQEQEARNARHAELVERFQDLLKQLERTAPQSFVSRGGWTASGEEFVVKITSVQLIPRRSLFVELDRDDDEVLLRWTSDVGEAIEVYHLLEFPPDYLNELMLQLVDQSVWHDAERPPPFPGVKY